MSPPRPMTPRGLAVLGALTVCIGAAGCATRGAAVTPDGAEPAMPRMPERAQRPAGRDPPSLADELRVQGARQARELGQKEGVRLEPVDFGAAPHWWPHAAGDTTRAVGSAPGASLVAAYGAAISRAAATARARGIAGDHTRAERAAWLALPDGRFHVWVVVGGGESPLEPPPPVDLPGGVP